MTVKKEETESDGIGVEGTGSKTGTATKVEDEHKVKTEKGKKQKKHVWGTSDEEIARLCRQYCEYYNLNPFAVLQLPYDHDAATLKKHYRQLSLRIHPDKNPENESAQRAFDFVNSANKMLQDPEKQKAVQDVVEEARRRIAEQVAHGYYRHPSNGNKIHDAELVLPTNPSSMQYDAVLARYITKLFIENRAMAEEKAQLAASNKRREEEARIEKEQDRKRKREADEAWEAGREDRMESWHSFVKKGKGSTGATAGGPGKNALPKLKVEGRDKAYEGQCAANAESWKGAAGTK